jgi:hypothetical protein
LSLSPLMFDFAVDWRDAGWIVQAFYVFVTMSGALGCVHAAWTAWTLHALPSRPSAADTRPGESVDEADARFHYLAGLVDARIAAGDALVRFVFFATLLAAVASWWLEIGPAYGDAHPSRTMGWAVYIVVSTQTVRLGAGLVVCVVLTALTGGFRAALRRRQATWAYAVACAGRRRAATA